MQCCLVCVGWCEVVSVRWCRRAGGRRVVDGGGRAAVDGGRRECNLKTKTPHSDVGNNMFSLNENTAFFYVVCIYIILFLGYLYK